MKVNSNAPGVWGNSTDLFSAAIDSPWYKLVFKLMDTFVYASMDVYRKEGLSPALMPITCESVSSPMGLGSDSMPVSVNLFGKKTFLADSMQFQLEYLMRQNPKGTWYIMPTFRGEDPDARHLNQFFHSEAEIPGDLNDVTAFVGRYIHSVTQAILDEHADELEKISGDLSHIKSLLALNGDFVKISYSDAVEMLGGDLRFYDELPGGVQTISGAGERALMDALGGFVWLTHLPAKAAPFYQATDLSGEFALCADLLMGIGETVGCGQRNTTEAETLEALSSHHVSAVDYDWYVRMKRDYPMQTSGFGLGLERYLLWLLNHSDIRDVHLISRLKGHFSAP